MIDLTKLLEEIKASPYEELEITAPHTGTVKFGDFKKGDKVLAPSGAWREKPGSLLATLERERNPKPITSPLKGDIAELYSDLNGKFVEAGTPLLRLRHFLSKEEVLDIILKKTLHIFQAPERAKYYFVPELDNKIKASGAKSVTARAGMEMFIMSRMKRETPVAYEGPEGIVYAVYFQYNEVKDAGEPLIGVCPPDQYNTIQDVVVRVQTEWIEQD